MLDEAVTKLKQIYAMRDKNEELTALIDARDDVLARFQLIFSAAAIPTLTAADFQDFLLFKNNRHWTGLYRQKATICNNMDVLRQALLGLHNVSVPIEDRFDVSEQAIKGMGKGILSAVLHIMYPHDFGVWNGASEAALKLLNVWPALNNGASLGKRYKAINDVLHQLANAVGTDLWVLDALLWATLKKRQ